MLENDLYDLFNENNQQILDEILDEILEEIYFYPFIARDSVASTIAFNETIYIQGKSAFFNTFENFIIVYTFQIISLLYELFHFYFNNMRYISQGKNKYDSPMPKYGSSYAKTRKGESGFWKENKKIKYQRKYFFS